MRKETLDALVRELLVASDNRCFTCGRSDETLAVSHLLEKGAYPALRWDRRNVHLQCYRCHERHHKGDKDYIKKWLATYGENEYYRLKRCGNSRMTKQDVQDTYDILKTEIIAKRN